MENPFCVSYAKISLDKEDGVELLGVFFGGLGSDINEAETIAIECVNSTKGCTVIPCIIELEDEHDFLDKLDESYERFKKKIKQMQEAYQIINRPMKRKTK